MPGRNGTGPTGEGPLTGRMQGYCGAGAYGAPGRAARTGGYGCGLGRGRGYCRTVYAPGAPYAYRGAVPYDAKSAVGDSYDEKAVLNRRAAALEGQLNQIKGRLANLDANED